MRDALADLEAWSHIWVIYLFHRRGDGWRPKVQPPRSDTKRGVLATRSPHRPNPIGISALKLLRVDDCILHVSNVDMLDGTPVLDIKPYVAYTDAIAEANDGWLKDDPRPRWQVTFAERAARDVAWLAARGVVLEVEKALSLGPRPHAYRRIKREGEGYVLAIKDWRVRFDAASGVIHVRAIESGWRDEQIDRDPALEIHRAFRAR